MVRQARTTESLKERMADALIDLLRCKPYAEISVSEITARADVGRATYYRHFASKDDVVLFKFQTIFAKTAAQPHPPGHPREWMRERFATYLQNLLGSRTVFEAVYAAGLDYLLFAYLYRNPVAAVDSAEPIDRYVTALHSASMFAIVDQWISSGFAQSPDELTEMLLAQMARTRYREQ